MTTSFRMGLLALALIVVAAGCGAVAAKESNTHGVTTQTTDQVDTLADCAVADVALGTPPVTAKVSRVDAEKAARVIGARAGADSTLLTTVTLGTRANQAPTPATAARDGSGVPILNRAAWIFVFRGLNLPRPGAIPHGVPLSQVPPIMTVASVIDAETGEFLGGWECR